MNLHAGIHLEFSYARTFLEIYPNTSLHAGIRMSKPAADILQKFYLRLRDQNTSADGTPITARQLESLVRLAEARARVDLREEITVQDAMVSYTKMYPKFNYYDSNLTFVINFAGCGRNNEGIPL